ncbi:MAG: penicillin-binding protein 2 [Solirubrobacterales bacterium]|nr:penicillin-binding protein 2 [Solirubrobacterales bacterium]
MNAPILRLFLVVLVLFAALVAFTSRWTVFEAQALQENPLNARDVLKELQVRRGSLRAADGTLLARSVAGSANTYRREYTDAARDAAHVIGYSYPGPGRAGVERSRNEALMGAADPLDSVLDELRGRADEGDDVVTTIDLRAQRTAIAALAGRKGSVVAIEPRTGRVRVMVSVPGFDPGALGERGAFTALNADADAPLLNRATQARYPPGSTFKVVTAAAALDTGRFSPDSFVDGSSPKVIDGVALANSGGRSFGPISLITALTFSVNTVWAQVAERLGASTMDEYMRRFGFYEEPPLDYPDDQLVPSGVYRSSRLLPLTGGVDVGRVAIGQERLQVTPLQMAMVAAAVGNEGQLMRPTLTQRIVDRAGRTLERVEPAGYKDVMAPDAAQRLARMMTNVVAEGTGTAAALTGVDIAGKTGTAERGAGDVNQPWFIAFAPVRSARIAIAVTVERTIGGQGGTTAAPIARQVLRELLR